MKIFANKIFESFNLKKQADDLGIKIWQTPSFIFLLMGLISIAAIFAVYYASKSNNSPEILLFSEVAVVTVIMTIGTYIIKSVEEVAKANKMKSEFVSVASHQLKTPLAQINWELELLMSKYKKGLRKKQIEIIDTIAQSNCRMTRLANDLLDVARIDQGKLVLTKEKRDFLRMVEDSAKQYEPLALEKGVEIRLLKPSELPLVDIDPRRMKVVLDNLISNAVKYIEKNGYVEIKIEKKSGYVEICVRDNGLGIPEEQQDKVFEKFFRSHNIAKYQTEGTGLGLYIAKNIVESLGGRMWFKSIEGVGSAFFFTIPLASAPEKQIKI